MSKWQEVKPLDLVVVLKTVLGRRWDEDNIITNMTEVSKIAFEMGERLEWRTKTRSGADYVEILHMRKTLIQKKQLLLKGASKIRSKLFHFEPKNRGDMVEQCLIASGIQFLQDIEGIYSDRNMTTFQQCLFEYIRGGPNLATSDVPISILIARRANEESHWWWSEATQLKPRTLWWWKDEQDSPMEQGHETCQSGGGTGNTKIQFNDSGLRKSSNTDLETYEENSLKERVTALENKVKKLEESNLKELRRDKHNYEEGIWNSPLSQFSDVKKDDITPSESYMIHDESFNKVKKMLQGRETW